MTTTVIKVKGSVVPEGLPIINIPQEEYSIIGIASLIEWFRADTGVSGSTNGDFKWIGRKNGFQLVPARSGVPTVSSALQNGRAALDINGYGDLYNKGDNGLWPMNSDFTIVTVARAAVATNGVAIGNMAAADYSYIRFADNRKIFSRNKASVSMLESTAAVYGGPALALVVLSFDYATKTATQIVNRTDVATRAGVSDILNSQLRVGAAGPVAASFGQLAAGGAVAEILTFNKALHKPENLENLALVQNYLMTRYAI